ncbi:MAG: hypothetical protein E7476_12565 [Ruminococcaceae bacterium]|nr:hypothetical protein [Oscillospiraceae bacterium]
MQFDDSDMKIAPERISEVFDTSEGAANAFVREKSNGNMDKARKLGQQFAAELTVPSKGATLFGVGVFDNDNTMAQRKVLFAYVVNRVVEDMAPNSIVAQSVLSSFYESVRQQSAELYDLINDSAAFSLYMLARRSAPEKSEAVGRVFAQLCDKEGNPVFIRYGAELTDYFMMYCTQIMLRMQLIR